MRLVFILTIKTRLPPLLLRLPSISSSFSSTKLHMRIIKPLAVKEIMAVAMQTENTPVGLAEGRVFLLL